MEDESHGLGHNLELSAPGMQDSYATAAVHSDVLGREITAVQISLNQFASQLPEGSFRDGMTRVMAHYDRHGLPGWECVDITRNSGL